jgi:hypothetical protein
VTLFSGWTRSVMYRWAMLASSILNVFFECFTRFFIWAYTWPFGLRIGSVLFCVHSLRRFLSYWISPGWNDNCLMIFNGLLYFGCRLLMILLHGLSPSMPYGLTFSLGLWKSDAIKDINSMKRCNNQIYCFRSILLILVFLNLFNQQSLILFTLICS